MKGGYWQSTATCKTSHHCLSTKQAAFLFTTTYICITLSAATRGKIYCNPDVFLTKSYIEILRTFTVMFWYQFPSKAESSYS